AGTITPAALVVLRGAWRWSTLAVAWGLAACGVVLQLTPLDISDGLDTTLYLSMGWGVVFCYFELARSLSHRAMRPALAGGVLYSVGAVINLVRWPAFWPGVFAAHELFHLFVMGGTLSHYWFMLKEIVPYERPADLDAGEEGGDAGLEPSLAPGRAEA